MSKTAKYTVPIWLSDWTLEDYSGRKYYIKNIIVKGENKGEIFLNKNIVDKVVRKLNGKQKKTTLKAINLTLKSQHGFGIKE